MGDPEGHSGKRKAKREGSTGVEGMRLARARKALRNLKTAMAARQAPPSIFVGTVGATGDGAVVQPPRELPYRRKALRQIIKLELLCITNSASLS